MPKARKIIGRIRAVRKIRAVAKTMEMISTARFKRTHGRSVSGRRYTERLYELTADLLARAGKHAMNHPLLTPSPRNLRHDVMIVITGNRGLCGSYNSAVLDVAQRRLSQIAQSGYKVSLRVAGKKGVQYFSHQGAEIESRLDGFDRGVDVNITNAWADELMDKFVRGRISGVEVAYTQLLSASRCAAVIAQILPLTELPRPKTSAAGEPVPYEIIPSASEMLDRLLPATVRMRLYQCFLDASVAEQVARMSAMRAATDSADDMIHDMTVYYNRLRQSQITTELTEIIGGRTGVR